MQKILNGHRRSITRRARALISLLPWGEDIVGHYWDYPRTVNSFRGVFETREEALEGAGLGLTDRYDETNKKKTVEEEAARVADYFDNSDYPVLFWLCRSLHHGSRILELGGRFGHAFYAYDRLLNFTDGVRWTVWDLPGAVEVGDEIARLRGESRLSFVHDLEQASVPAPDIFMSSGTLQYMEQNVEELLQALSRLPEHVMVHRVPMYEGPEFWTLQNLKHCEVAYRIRNRLEVIQSIEGLGYTLVDSWHKDRKVLLPFRQDRKVDAYHGLYFQRVR